MSRLPRLTSSEVHKLTWDHIGEGAAHSHRGEGGGGSAKGGHGWRRSTKGREASSITVVAMIGGLHSRRGTHHSRVRPIVAQVSVDCQGIGVVGSVLQRWALVLFTLDTTHRQACGERGRRGRLLRIKSQYKAASALIQPRSICFQTCQNQWFHLVGSLNFWNITWKCFDI